MKPHYLSLLDDAPRGFVTGQFGKRELLSGVVVLLAADCESAYTLLPDFRARVEGLVLTVGPAKAERVGPLLWHVSLPREAVHQGDVGSLLELARLVIATASELRDESIAARLGEERLIDEQSQRAEDYQRINNALQEQVALLAASENKLQTILDSVDACIYLKDRQYRYIFANRATREHLARGADDIIGFADEDFFDEATAALLKRSDVEVLERGRTTVGEDTNTVRGSDKTVIYRSTKLPLLGDDGQIFALCGVSTDITQLKEREAQLKHIAHYDVLTMLPNRVWLADRLQQAIAQSLRNDKLLAVAYLDLDGFKTINDRHGHGVGDQLLVALAQRMKETLRESDTLARLGGDEFIAVLLDLANRAASVPMITRLLAAAAAPVHIDGLVLTVSASLGVTFFPQAEDVDADQLLRQADQAMYQAKLAGKNRYHFFDAEKDRSARGLHESLEHIRQALINREFVLHYQPKVNMRSGQVIGAEALVRWQHPQRGLLLPGTFLPVIENHPLAVSLGQWVIDEALRQIEVWQAAGLNLPVSVNVGARQLLQPAFAASLMQSLEQHPKVSPTQLEIEIVETSALEDLPTVSTIIETCKKIGVRFSLDDFGTGYSSLGYLKRLPVDQLKIDRSFVSDMLDDPDDLTILDGVLSLAVAFDLQVIAEGVESEEQGAMLLRLGCDLGQGYGIARPMPAHELAEWTANWQTKTSWKNIAPARREFLPLLYALAEHRAWARGVEDCAQNGGANAPQAEALCRFTAWLQSADARTLTDFVNIEHVVALHHSVHQSAQDLCCAPRKTAGAGERVANFSGIVNELSVNILAAIDASSRMRGY